MSASESRKRTNPYARVPSIRKGGGGCYAIASQFSSASGIYFSEEEARKEILGVGSSSDRSKANAVGFQKFDKVKDAEIFLQNLGYVPTIRSGGWISARNNKPILYSPTNQIVKKTNGNNPNPCGRVTPTNTTSTKTASTGGNSQQLWSNYEHQRDRLHVTSHPHQSLPFRPTITIDTSPESVASDGVKYSRYFEQHRQQQQQQQQQQPSQRHNKRQRSRSDSDSSISLVEANSNDDQHRVKSDACDTMETSPPSPEVERATPEFDAVQQKAIDAALIGKNVFLTGVAGTGKSLVTKKIVEDAKSLGKEVAVAAPTGVAAVNLGPELGAQTVHSLAGVGVPQTASGFEKMLAPWTVKKWKKIQVLVLDEIGMLGADFLDWMDVYVRKARKKPLEPFGGIQLIFVGDFAQLGPIPGRCNSLRNKAFEPDQPGADCIMNVSECAAYAFQTVLWREADFHHVHLRKVYRQKNKDFQLALMDIREAKADSQRVKDLVDTCSTPLDNREGLQIPEGIKPTILYCTNRNVDKENFENLAKLPDRGKIFEATDSTSISGDVNLPGRDAVGRMLTNNSFFKDCSASKKIHLKVGAQVMLLQNLDLKQGLVNGSRGVVEKFALCPVVKDIIRGEEQLIGPDDMDKFPGCRFEDLKFNQKTDFEGKIWRICRFDRYPLVRFVNNVSRIIVPETFERVLYRQGKCMRKQIPLRLAWALTIHKSQGATLDYVVCDLQGCFTSGQAYVALSRARSMQGLEIKNFSSKHVTADPLVEAFYNALDRHDMKNFLEEQAGLWWFPILNSPSWLRMFQYASSKTAKMNAKQFRSWVAEYKPLEGYKGWGV